MKFWDLMGMSCGNLWRRKLRTFLTVLGVVIGTASIVVMVSLGLALNKSTMESMERSGGLTTITVTSDEDTSSESSSSNKEPKGITDEVISQFESIDHVTLVSPVLEYSVVAKQGRYVGDIQVIGMSVEGLEKLNIDLGSGRLPKEGESLAFVYGNQATSYFTDSTKSEWDYSEENADIDLSKPMYYIFDTDSYYATQSDSDNTGFSMDDEDSSSDTEEKVIPPKKYIMSAVGVEAGSEDDSVYSDTNYNVYCDVEALITQLKKVFKNKPITGQPTTKSGKAYKNIYYTSAYIKIDNMDNAKEVQQEIKDMGYTPEWNAEWIQEQQKQYQSIQLILGGIGAVSLFVAAIGIANTMMMSIYERTKEIGILKVLGCSLSNIRTMFLMEASMIGFIGGIVGIILSEALSWLLNNFGSAFTALSDYAGDGGSLVSYIPFWLIGLALIFAVLVGALAGFFPALRAMKLSPLAAIRTE